MPRPFGEDSNLRYPNGRILFTHFQSAFMKHFPPSINHQHHIRTEEEPGLQPQKEACGLQMPTCLLPGLRY